MVEDPHALLKIQVNYLLPVRSFGATYINTLQEVTKNLNLPAKNEYYLNITHK
jgi:hypothetical protein